MAMGLGAGRWDRIPGVQITPSPGDKWRADDENELMAVQRVTET